MRMISWVCGVLLAAVVCGGCLQKEESQTIYLSPAGTVWSVVEKDVRSDEKAAGARMAEEQDYVLAAGAGQHGVALAFRALGAQSVMTTWLRRERPYSVMTEARFADVRQLVTAILREAKIRGDVTLVREGCQTKLEVRMDLEPAPESIDESPLAALLVDPVSFRLVLTEGRFISTDGFEILGDGSIAVPGSKNPAVDGVLTLALAWADETCR
jgi:hypothetical protein